jgi:hypothetical protein
MNYSILTYTSCLFITSNLWGSDNQTLPTFDPIFEKKGFFQTLPTKEETTKKQEKIPEKIIWDRVAEKLGVFTK